MGAAAAEFMRLAVTVYKGAAMSDLVAPVQVVPAPVIVQGMPIIATRPLRGVYGNGNEVRVPVWPREVCTVVDGAGNIVDPEL